MLLGLLAAAGCRAAETPPEAGPATTPAPPPKPPSATPPSTERARVDAVKAVRERLRPLHQRLGPPKPGEWLAEHREAGQTFEQYLQDDPTLPEGARRVLVIQPLGDLDERQRRMIGLAADYMKRFFSLETRTLPDIPGSAIPARARRTHPTWGDKQILSTYVLESVLRPRLPDDAAAMIAFTASDLWPGAGWNFVFGQADLRQRTGVWSIYRNGDLAAGPDAFRRALLRTLKTAVHETGHMFSLEHCTAYRCVQGGVNSLEEGDRAPLWLCPECVAKVVWATRADPRRRYEALAAFCKEQGLEAEAAFFDRSIAAL